MGEPGRTYNHVHTLTDEYSYIYTYTYNNVRTEGSKVCAIVGASYKKIIGLSLNHNFITFWKTSILTCIHTYSIYRTFIPLLNNHIRPVMKVHKINIYVFVHINNFLTDGPK